MCVHCYGQTGYDTYEGLGKNYGVILEEGHVHREALKTFAYFAKADGDGILVRSLMENSPEDFDLLYKPRVDKVPIVIDVGFFACGNITFMSQIELPDGTLVSYPTMVYGMPGDAGTEREAVERFYGYMREKLVHGTGDHDDFANPFRPYTVPPLPGVRLDCPRGGGRQPVVQRSYRRGVPGAGIEAGAVHNCKEDKTWRFSGDPRSDVTLPREYLLGVLREDCPFMRAIQRGPGSV